MVHVKAWGLKGNKPLPKQMGDDFTDIYASPGLYDFASKPKINFYIKRITVVPSDTALHQIIAY